MSWKKYFAVVPSNISAQQQQRMTDFERMSNSSGTTSKYSSFLPLIYAGHPNRIQRYYQYDDMDRDSDVNAALDCIADFCTQSEEQADEPLEIHYNEDASETEVLLLKKYLAQWVKLNDFRSKLWFMFRNTIKNGDAFFLRDPETFEWLWLDHYSVEGVKIDEEKGKEPTEYLVRGLDYNKQAKFAAKKTDMNNAMTPYGPGSTQAARPMTGGMSAGFQMAGGGRDPRQMRMMQTGGNELMSVDAKNVVHLSLSVGMDINWPFGTSILDAIFKVYKQKELLEDSIIIYRVQRAPERRVFYIDVGQMPPAKARAYIDSIKNEIHQRRIPNQTGGGSSVLDASYSPMSVLDDYFFAQGCFRLNTSVPLLDGRTLTFGEIIKEFQEGKENFIYSMNEDTHKFESGKIAWAGITRKNAEMVRVYIDNGEHVDCTPDHRFIMRDGREVEAQYLTLNDSLMPLYRDVSTSGPSQTKSSYERIICNATGKKVFTHLSVCNKPIGRETVVHHKNLNSRDNNPTNLEIMTAVDHRELHRVIGSYSLKKQWADVEARAKLIKGMHHYHDTISENRKEELNVQRKANGFKTQCGAHGERIRNNHVANLKQYNEGMKTVYSDEMLSRFVELYDEGSVSLRMMIPSLNNDDIFLKSYSVANNGRTPPNDDGIVRGLAFNLGYEDWDTFRSTAPRTRIAQLAHESIDNLHRERLIALNQNRTLRYTSDMFERMRLNYDLGYVSVSKMSTVLANDEDFWNLFEEANFDVKKNKGTNHRTLNSSVFDKISVAGGYKGWGDFKNSYAINHKVLRVEWLEEREDTADITVENSSGSHLFALGIGVYVHNSEGRGSKVETLPGGENLGEITDLTFFSKKMGRGLRIPTTYLSLGEDDGGGAAYNDGKLGAALIQEFRFNKYCMRLQSLLAPRFDEEFRCYLEENGVEIEPSLFELRFLPPQNFTKYRQIEIDQAQVGVFQMVSEVKWMAKRMAAKRYLDWSDDEILENERLWQEENPTKLKSATGSTPAESGMGGADLSAVGIRPPGDDMMGDMPTGEGEMPPEGGPTGAPGGPSGGAPPGGGGGSSGGAPPGPGM